MSKAEKFISEHTRDCSNIFEGYYPNGKQSYFPWIHPKQARKAVEIAKEEIYEWLSYHLDTSKMDVDYKFEVIEELRKAMKNE